MVEMELDHERCYRIVSSADARFDGWFVTAVRSTGIYCRPSCPAMTPKAANVGFFPTAAAAQAGGFRACKRCRPDATPGSPEWDARADAVGRSMRLICDGIVEREGVGGLARRVGYSERQLNRILRAELGAGPKALARSQNAQTARLLLETTALPISEVAFAAGFGSIRQFNDTVRSVFDVTPTELRAKFVVPARGDDIRGAMAGTTSPKLPSELQSISLRLPIRKPFAADQMYRFLAYRTIEGVESAEHGLYRRTMSLPHGAGVATAQFFDDHIQVVLQLESLADLQTAAYRLRRLFDADADPVAVDEVLRADPLLAKPVSTRRGLRSPGTVDGCEIATRAIVGQQISVPAAGKVLAGIGQKYGTRLEGFGLSCFPTANQLASANPEDFPMPRSRGRTIVAVAEVIASGELVLDAGADWETARHQLLAIKGIGPWTADYISMRGLGNPDVMLLGDVGVARGFSTLGGAGGHFAEHARRWSPWGSYATHHLWAVSPD